MKSFILNIETLETGKMTSEEKPFLPYHHKHKRVDFGKLIGCALVGPDWDLKGMKQRMKE